MKCLPGTMCRELEANFLHFSITSFLLGYVVFIRLKIDNVTIEVIKKEGEDYVDT